MEVIHVVLGKANPLRMNGVNKVVNELATRQAASGLKVSVWGIAADKEHNYPKRLYNTRLFYKSRFPFRIGDDLVAAIAAKPRDTVFHLHGGFVPQMYAVSVHLRRFGLQFVITPHGSYNLLAMQKSELVKNIYKQLFESRLLRRARFVHVLGKSEIAGTEMLCGKPPVVRIPYGFEGEGQIGAIQHIKKPFIVGYCGRLDIFTKGLDALLYGFKMFLKVHADSELWIVGDGAGNTALRAMAENAGMGAKVLFCGPRYGTEKVSFLRRFDVFAHPSRNEGLPASVLEAASLGLPCLVTRATNVGEEVEKYGCGICLNETEASDVCRGLISLYNDLAAGKREEIAANSIRMVEEAYNWDNIIERYTTMYETALTTS